MFFLHSGKASSQILLTTIIYQNEQGALIIKQNHAYFIIHRCRLNLLMHSFVTSLIGEKGSCLFREYFQISFITKAIIKSEVFVNACVLPKLVGRYTKMPSITATSDTTNDNMSCNASVNQEIVYDNNYDENQEASDNGSENDVVATNAVLDLTDDNICINIVLL